MDDADRLEVLDILVDEQCPDDVLDHLVLPASDPRLFGRHLCERDAAVVARLEDGAHDAVYMLLIQLAEDGRSLPGLAHQRVHLVPDGFCHIPHLESWQPPG